MPSSSTRVSFRQGADEEFVELFREAARGSLDVETRRALEIMDEVSQAGDDFAFYESCPAGAGLVAGSQPTPKVSRRDSSCPRRRRTTATWAIWGASESARPRHRGRLAGRGDADTCHGGAERITATTDLTNLPMAAAFDRAGYQVTEIRLVLEVPR